MNIELSCNIQNFTKKLCLESEKCDILKILDIVKKYYNEDSFVYKLFEIEFKTHKYDELNIPYSINNNQFNMYNLSPVEQSFYIFKFILNDNQDVYFDNISDLLNGDIFYNKIFCN